MSAELSLRQRAMRLKLAGWAVTLICHTLGRGRDWFYKWWRRYQAEGAQGLRDRSHAPKANCRAMPDDLRQAILRIRDRLMRRHGPRERYRWAGAATIRHELECLGYRPLPSLRTIERVLQAAERTSPAFRSQPRVASSDYPRWRITHSNQRHQVDLIGPRYLNGSRRQWYFLVCRDVYDHAVYIEFQPKPRMETLLAFGVRAWQRLGLPDVVQVDNSDLFGLTSHPGSLSRFVRLALLVGVQLTFIPEHEPWRNGSIENFNGWLQERLLAIPLRSPGHARRELDALMHTCCNEHLHPQLNFQTTAQVRRGLVIRKLPHDFHAHRCPLPVAIGRVIFIRRVRPSGRITLLGVKYRVGKRWSHHYVVATLYTRTMPIKIRHQPRLLCQANFPFVGKRNL
jgi:homeodomain-containing protein